MKAADMQKALKGFTYAQLAQMQMGLSMTGRVFLSSIAHPKALKCGLIQEDGTPHDLEALSNAVDQALSKQNFLSLLWDSLFRKA